MQRVVERAAARQLGTKSKHAAANRLLPPVLVLLATSLLVFVHFASIASQLFVVSFLSSVLPFTDLDNYSRINVSSKRSPPRRPVVKVKSAQT